MNNFRRERAHADVEYSADPRACVRGADAVVIMTAADEFRALTQGDFLTLMSNPVVVDARRIFDPEDFQSIEYLTLGLGPLQSVGRDSKAPTAVDNPSVC